MAPLTSVLTAVLYINSVLEMVSERYAIPIHLLTYLLTYYAAIILWSREY